MKLFKNIILTLILSLGLISSSSAITFIGASPIRLTISGNSTQLYAPSTGKSSIQLSSSGIVDQANYPTALRFSSSSDQNYFTFMDSSGNANIGSYNNSTTTIHTFNLHSALGVDAHDTPAIYIRTDNKILAMYSKHDLENKIYYRISTNAEDVTAWGTESTLTIGTLDITFIKFMKLGTTLFCFFSDGSTGSSDSRWYYMSSTDEGTTWSAATYFLFNHFTGNEDFIDIASDGTHIYFIECENPSNGKGHNISGFYFDGTNFFNLAGTQVGSVPFSGQSENTLVNGSHLTLQIGDLKYINGGLYMTYLNLPTGKGIIDWYWASISGAIATSHFLGSSFIIYSGSNYTSADSSIDDQDQYHVYFSTPLNLNSVLTTSPGNPMTIYDATSGDNGTTWTYKSLNIDSTVQNFRANVILNHNSTNKVVWCHGAATNYDSYSTELDMSNQ